MQVHDPRTTGMHWQIGKGGGFHYAVAEARGEALPVTVFLGGPPALILAAIAPLPENVPELLLASLVAGGKLARCPGPGPPPARRRAPSSRSSAACRRSAAQPEGPFGDHYGYYSLRHDYPVFEVERLCRRRDAIFPATVVGKPRQEDFFIGDLLQELLSPLFPLVMPGVVDLWSYGETGYHSLAAAVVRERYAREAMASAFRILGRGAALADQVPARDRPRRRPARLPRRPRRTCSRARTPRPTSSSSPTSRWTRSTTPGRAVNEGSKGVWLGLGDAGARAAARVPPRRRAAGEVHARCASSAPAAWSWAARPWRRDPGAARALAAHPAFAGWPLVVLTDEPARAAASPMNFLWTTFTRFEPAADVHAARSQVVRNHVALTAADRYRRAHEAGLPGRALLRRGHRATVTRRWREYFPDGAVEMGDSGAAHLD